MLVQIPKPLTRVQNPRGVIVLILSALHLTHYPFVKKKSKGDQIENFVKLNAAKENFKT